MVRRVLAVHTYIFLSIFQVQMGLLLRFPGFAVPPVCVFLASALQPPLIQAASKQHRTVVACITAEHGRTRA